MRLPSALAANVETWDGDTARLWLSALPETLVRAAQRWGLEMGDPFEPGGVTAYVAPAVTSEGARVVYKCTIPHDEAISEAEALRLYEGDGAVRVTASEPDTFEMLIEYCEPGSSLWNVGSDDERLQVATTLMRRLWRPVDAGTFTSLGALTDSWAAITTRRLITLVPPWTPKPIERGIDLLQSLPHTTTRNVLLHQDLHPGNILAAQREPWLVIDPKPVVGDPAFDPVQLLIQSRGNVQEPPPHAELESRVAMIADLTGLDTERVALWAIARCAEWTMWYFDRGLVVDAAINYTWARYLDAIFPD